MSRAKLDFYETPPHYIRRLIGRVDIRGTVYDCCVGRGAIVQFLKNNIRGVTRIYTNDINKRHPATSHVDATLPESWGTLGFDWCITNPPFSQEQEILTHALQFCKNVAFLARLSFLEPTKGRSPFWSRYQDRLTDLIVLPRYSFRRNDKGARGNDTQTCVWLVFKDSRKYTSTQRIHITNWRSSK